MLYVDNILRLFGKSSIPDPIGERYNRYIVGSDLDDNIMPAIDRFIPNNVEPATMLEGLLPYMELGRGKDYQYDNLTMPAYARRTAARYLIRTNGLRGTLKNFKVLFGWLGLSVAISKTFTNQGFDSGLDFDSDIRDFDSWCNVCMYLDIVLTGTVPLTQELIDAVESIIRYNIPINAELQLVTYNGQPLVITLGDFNGDFNDDFY